MEQRCLVPKTSPASAKRTATFCEIDKKKSRASPDTGCREGLWANQGARKTKRPTLGKARLEMEKFLWVLALYDFTMMHVEKTVRL
jgi:hypothetical protein